MMIQAATGSLMGIGRVILLPLDVLKINQQINPDVFRGCGVVKIFIEEGTTLYRGWGWSPLDCRSQRSRLLRGRFVPHTRHLAGLALL
jgi:hypothetical protein